MNCLRRHIALGFLLICCLHAPAQPFPAIKFTDNGINALMNGRDIRAIYEDSRGVIWLGTTNGSNDTMVQV